MSPKGEGMYLIDILGPVMVGPSSSHTAGAVKLGRMAARLLGEKPVTADIGLVGSFAETGRGHGTDRALIAGILDMDCDDTRIPESFDIARENGLSFTFRTVSIKGAHPNTARIELTGAGGTKLTMEGASLGGGRVSIRRLNGMQVNFSGEAPTLIIQNHDEPGVISKVSGVFSQVSQNIASMLNMRDKRGGLAVMVLELDSPVPPELCERIRSMPEIESLMYWDQPLAVI